MPQIFAKFRVEYDAKFYIAQTIKILSCFKFTALNEIIR